MTVAKVTTDSYGNLGRKGTRQDNEMVAIDGIILTAPDFSDSIADLALQATWDAGIKAGTVFPLTGLDGYEDQSSEDGIYEAASGNRKLLKRGKTRYRFQFDVPFSVHRTLMRDFNNADLRVFFVRNGKLDFYNDNGTGKGYSLSMLNIGRMQEVPADGSTPGFTPIFMDLSDYREHDMYGELLEPTWNVNDLEALIDVELEEVSASSTEVVVRVFSADGYDSAGATKKVAIKGIIEGDFVTGFGTATGFTDNANGTYTFTGTGFTTSTVNLKAPTAMASTGLLINSTGAAAITI